MRCYRVCKNSYWFQKRVCQNPYEQTSNQPKVYKFLLHETNSDLQYKRLIRFHVRVLYKILEMANATLSYILTVILAELDKTECIQKETS